MPDYKAMYYHLAGRMATAVEALEATTNALVAITEKMKLAQQTTEEMFISTPVSYTHLTLPTTERV